MNAQPELFMFAGRPGAGKTTVAQLIEDITGAEHIWTDRERHEMFGETYNPTDSKLLYEMLNKRAEELLEAGKSVIYDTNFSYFKDRELMRGIAGKHQARAVLVYLTTSKEISMERAVGNQSHQATRQYTNMSEADFELIDSHLEVPRPSDHAIELNGIGLTREIVEQAIRVAAE
jgi:predicted kinase